MATKTVLVPPGVHAFDVVQLAHPRTGTPTSFLAAGDRLFELRCINGNNPHAKGNHMRPETSHGSAVKLLVLESTRGGPGYVVQSPNLQVASAFNLAFLWIGLLADKNSSRYQLLEDLMDSWSSAFPPLDGLSSRVHAAALAQVCDKIVEGDEDYFRFSQERTVAWLKSRVDRLVDRFPQLVLNQLLKLQLAPVDPSQAIPDDVLTQSMTQHAVYLVGTYLAPALELQLMALYSLPELAAYKTQLAADREKVAVAETNLALLAQANTAPRTTTKRKAPTKPPPKKKPAVAKGKGALDLFFRPASA